MSAPVVSTRYGRVQGRTVESAGGRHYFAFQGIPYAKQPVDEFRFKDPRPLESWTEVLDASKQGPSSWTFGGLTADSFITGPNGSDNCLTLNIYTTSLRPWKPLPVLVWIHGGGFLSGSGTTVIYGPDYIIEKGVLMVSFNYRTGLFGFLSFKDPELGLPGNAGLKDQVMAMKWVKENIASFGGDPNNITLAGESAGGASVHYHLVSPLSQGLFNKAICMSGVAFNAWAQQPSDKNYAHDLAMKLGWNGLGGDKEAYQIILKTPPEQLVGLVLLLLDAKTKLKYGIWQPFLPTVEPYETNFCFLPAPVLELGRLPWSQDINLLIGGCADEGYLYFDRMNQASFDEYQKDPTLLLPHEVRELLDSDTQTRAGHALKKLYFQETSPSFETKEQLFQLEGDRYFWHGIHRLVQQRLTYCRKAKIYYYRFASEHSKDTNFSKMYRMIFGLDHNRGTAHGEGIPFLFKTSRDAYRTEKSEFYQEFQKFIGSLTRFAKVGHPNDTMTMGSLKWEPVVDGRIRLMNMGEKWEMIEPPNLKRLDCFDALYQKNQLL